MGLSLLLVALGLPILARGADVFVVSASRLAVTLNLSPVVVGAVVVGFGTGAPELLVSTVAAARGSIDLAAGNVVGSNLANLTLVLGVAGVAARPEILPRVVRREAPLSLAAVAVFALLLQGGLTRAEGGVLIAVLVVSVGVMLRASEAASGPPVDPSTAEFVEELEERIEGPGEDELADVVAASTQRDVVRVVVGLAATVAGAQLLVTGAQRIADDVGFRAASSG